MSYQVTKSYGNGYRCPCCTGTWSGSPKWIDDLAEALAEVPKERPEQTEDGGLHSVEVTDGSTGEVIARGEVSWPNWGRGFFYSYTRWWGYTPEGSFETIFEGTRGKVVTDRTWDEILDEAKKKKAEEDLRKAKFEYEKAQEKLKRLGGKTL